MPPSIPPMANFPRGGTYLQRLTKLYSDTKQSYESAQVTPASADIDDEPEVIALRRDFQMQQDRLLAWGMHWADVEAQYQGHDDVDIDKKIHQAGLGEVVASVMSEIKRLLDESVRLQHPEKYELSRGLRSPPSPNFRRKDWTMYEVKTGRALLDQLTNCIDVLYSLSDSRAANDKDEKGGKMSSKHAQQEYMDPNLQGVSANPLYIHFMDLDLDQNPLLHLSDPPPYEASEARLQARDRHVGFYMREKTPILVDYLSADCTPDLIGSADDVFELQELGQKLCKNRSLSWCGHLRLLGFTVNPAGLRCGMVYALPEQHGHKRLQRHQTLGAAITAGSTQESAQPTLEDRFRLAYNLLLSVLGYFAQGDCHRHVNTSNILLISDVGDPSLPPTRPNIRQPYLLQSSQDLVTQERTEEPFTSLIYRHPDFSVAEQHAVPAYDIYSLGLVLMEVGFWMPLAKLWKNKYDRQIFMERVQKVYTTKLASKCGTKYMKIVQRCLEAPAELHDKNKPEDSAAYLLEIARDLRTCCALDEDGPPPTSDIECFELLVIEQMCKSEALEEENKLKNLPTTTPILHRSIPIEDSTPIEKSEILRKPLPKQAGTLKKWPELDIPQQDLDQWNTLLMPRLSKLLQDTLRDSAESCSVSLMMVGSTLEQARTTICIQCANTSKVRDVLRKQFKLKKGWGLVILKGEVRRSGTKRKPRRAGYRGKQPAGKSQMRKLKEQLYQKRPSCGASIGAFKDNEHLPPVSFGGTVLIDGEPFGMTVHHMLDSPSEDEDEDENLGIQEVETPMRSAAPRNERFLNQFDAPSDLRFMRSDDDLARFSDLEISEDDDEGNEDSDSDASTIRPDYSILDADGNEFWFLEDTPPELEGDEGSDDDDASSSSSDGEDDVASIGDKLGVAPFSEDDLFVTQPAIDDVDEDFFPSEEDRDDDHLASHSFGYVHASSGIRRVFKGLQKHEVDWALIRVNEERLKVGNEIHNLLKSRRHGAAAGTSATAAPPATASQSRNDDGAPILTSIASSSKLGGSRVQCRGRSSGLRAARISQAMALVKMHGRRSFSYSWCVEGGFGIPGDSGAWVYNPETRELCGHVLAWGDQSKTAYIAPMEVLFEDIRARLNVRSVELPGSDRSIGKVAGMKAPQGKDKHNRSLGEEIEMALRDLRLDNTSSKRDSKRMEVDVQSLPLAGIAS